MRRFVAFIFIIAVIALPTAAGAKDPVPPCDYVNTFIGTAPLTDPAIIGYTPPVGWRVWAGFTFPGPSLPHAMVQLSPTTTFVTGSGYFYEDGVINGFTHTNKGHWNLCNISVMPVVTTLYIQGAGDRLGPYNSAGYGSHFSHENEEASPGYYRVYLDDYMTTVELTATRRTGFHRYTFPASKNSHILIDLEKANNTVTAAYVEIPNDHTIRGWQRMGRETVYFHAEFDRPFEQSGTWNGWRHRYFTGNTLTESGVDIGAYIRYTTTEGEQVQMKIGLSFVSMDGAEKNLRAENPGWDFEAVRRNSRAVWDRLLSTIEVEGGTHHQREMFYSSLYRLCMWPALRSDVDGAFTGADSEVEHADFEYFTNPSFWDTFRNKLALLNVIEPEVSRDIIRSCIDRGKKTGWMPSFFHGDHATSMVVGAYLRGLRDFDVEEAYRLMRKNATENGGPRGNLSAYKTIGWIPTVPVAVADVPPTPGRAGVTKTLEYAYDDYCLALMAKDLGKRDDYDLFMKQAQNYRNVYDPSTRFMRGRTAEGAWVEPFNPEFPYYGYMYREANAWQSTFFAPQDIPGLVGLMGGKEPFTVKLDSLFTLPWNPDYMARNTSCMIGQYSHGNQPDHQAPYLYNYIGAPWKTQYIVHHIMDVMYNVGEKGLALPGMDDAGEMTAWYVYSAMGFYPVAPGTPQYVIGSPAFERVIIHLPEYVYGGGEFTIIADGAGPTTPYIQSLEIDGKRSERTYITDNDLKANRTFRFRMGAFPNPSWGDSPKDAPPVIK